MPSGSLASGALGPGRAGLQVWVGSGGMALEALSSPGVRSSLQAEQQLVDCAQNFNNHGCQGYGPDRGGGLGGPKPLLISRGHFCWASYGWGTATASALGGNKIGPACGGGRSPHTPKVPQLERAEL